MSKLTLRYLDKTDLHQLGPFLKGVALKDYQHYDIFNKNVVSEYFFRKISKLLSDDQQTWILAAQDEEKIIGIITLTPMSWLKEAFGVGVAEMKNILVLEKHTNKREILQDLLFAVLQRCSQEGVVLLSCRIPTDEDAVIRSLEQEGFERVETLVTYLFDKRKYPLPPLKDSFQIRPFQPGDLENLIELVRGAFPLSRYYLDPKIPNEHVDRFHIKWVKECCKDPLANHLMVVEDQGQVIGFVAYKIDKDWEALTGYKIACAGFSTVSKKRVFVYSAVVRRVIQDIAQWYDFGNFDAAINNDAVIKIWQRFGLDLVRSKYTFHKWLDS